LGAVFGTALQLEQSQLGPPAQYATVLVVGILLTLGAFRCRTAFAHAILAWVAAAVLAMAQAGWRASWFDGRALGSSLEGRDIVVIGQVEGLPQPGSDALRFRLRVQQAWLEDRVVSLPQRIALSWYAYRPRVATVTAADEPDATEDQAARQPQALQAGERWRLTVRLKAPHGQRNPHGDDHELRLWEQGVQAVGYVRTAARHEPPSRIDVARGYWVERARQATRSAIARELESPALAGVIAALVMGDQQAIERADWDVFRATGVAHLMSISGLHITLFAWLAAAMLTAFWRLSVRWSPSWCLQVPAHLAGAWGGLLLALAYALFSGWGLPAQRTVLMLAVVVWLRTSARQWPWPQVWLVVMASIVLFDPWALRSAGFWLSFVAVGLLFATDPGHPGQPIRGHEAWRQALSRALGAGLRLLREQWVMTLALAPLSLLLFQQVSVVGLLANAFAIPWVTLVVTPLALLGLMFAPAWSLAGLLLEALMAILMPLSQLSWAILERPAAPWWCAAAGLLGGALLLVRVPWSMRLLGLPLILPVLLWQPPRPPSGSFELLAFDVGQGSAVLVRTAGHSLLYDAGPRYSRESDAGHRVLVPALRALGVRLDLLMLSHSDADHMGGAPALLARQPNLLVSSSLMEDHEFLAGLAAHRPCRSGQRWRWDGVDFEVLHPSEDAARVERKPNARSCVLRISVAGQGSALLAGDLEAAQEAELAQQAPLRADLLLAPHHGSRTSSSQALIDAVQPRLVVVQAGYRNRFGHPAQEVMARYHDQGIRVIETVRCGAATWRSDAPTRVHCERQQPRYWQHRLPDRPLQ
jgi:competence protein ComEC